MRKFCFFLLIAAAFPLQAQRLRVAFVGDPQVDNETELAYARRSVYRELRERKDLDLTVFLGDLANDDVTLLAPTRVTLDSLSCPWACVPGNHDRDFYGLKKGRAVSVDRTVDEKRPRDMATYTRVIGAPDTTFVRGGVRFILMHLAATPADMLAVLCAHIPFSEFAAKDSLEAILSVHPRLLMMCGHTHTMARHTLVFPGGLAVEEVLAGAACGSWWRGVPDRHGIPAATQNCGAPRCYYLADFAADGSYRFDYKVIGASSREKASAWIADTTRLVVNVYGGSVDGEVAVKIPGCRGWHRVPRRSEPAPEAYVVVHFNQTLEKPRSRNPLYIPMRTADSPHIWAVNWANDPSLLKALQRAEGRTVRIRYRDAAMSFTIRAKVQLSPGRRQKGR